MENIIKKAIEGGYKAPFYATYTTLDGVDFRNGMVLSVFFWESLGKACNWNNSDLAFKPIFQETEKKQYFYANTTKMPTWKANALIFHEINLTEGWTAAVKWLEETITHSN